MPNMNEGYIQKLRKPFLKLLLIYYVSTLSFIKIFPTVKVTRVKDKFVSAADSENEPELFLFTIRHLDKKVSLKYLLK